MIDWIVLFCWGCYRATSWLQARLAVGGVRAQAGSLQTLARRVRYPVHIVACPCLACESRANKGESRARAGVNPRLKPNCAQRRVSLGRVGKDRWVSGAWAKLCRNRAPATSPWSRACTCPFFLVFSCLASFLCVASPFFLVCCFALTRSISLARSSASPASACPRSCCCPWWC